MPAAHVVDNLIGMACQASGRELETLLQAIDLLTTHVLEVQPLFNA